MTTEQFYYDLASELAEHAPAQAQLLRLLLLQKEMREADVICKELGLSDANFRLLIGKLRGRGVEIVSKRTHAPDDRNKDVRYVYGIDTNEVEDWSSDRRKSVMTAWKRTTAVFERHLLSLDLPEQEVYEILGVMKYVTKTLLDIEQDAMVKKDLAVKEKQKAEAKRVVAEEQATVEAG